MILKMSKWVVKRCLCDNKGIKSNAFVENKLRDKLISFRHDSAITTPLADTMVQKCLGRYMDGCTFAYLFFKN